MHKYLELARVDKPIGSWLLFLPCSWSIALAPHEIFIFDPYVMALFGVGSLTMRSAACIINDMWDHDLDKHVERTKTRPIASGQVSLPQALAFLSVNLGVSLVVLLQLNLKCIALGIFSIFPVIFYPLCKRIINWPQMFLAGTINIGAMLGYTAVTNTWGLAITIPIYLASVCWTLIYDSIYAHQDIKDDLKMGIKSTAIALKGETKRWSYRFQAIMYSSLLLAAYTSDTSIAFPALTTVTMIIYANQIHNVNLQSTESCGSFFKKNRDIGLLILACILLGKIKL